MTNTDKPWQGPAHSDFRTTEPEVNFRDFPTEAVDPFLSKLLTATQQMADQVGERELSGIASELLDYTECDSRADEKELLRILGPDIWYQTKPVKYEPVRWAVVMCKEVIQMVSFIDKHGFPDTMLTTGQTSSHEFIKITRPATSQEVLQFVKELLS